MTIVMDKIPDGGFVVFNFFREGQGLSDQARNTLAKRVVEALNVAGLAGFLADCFVAFRGHGELLTPSR